ncbi:MAG: S8 family serine peptidase [Burkholderiales bacterium]
MRSWIGAVLLMMVALIGAGAVRAQGTEAQTRQQVLVLLTLPPQHFRPDGNYAGSYSDAAGRVARRRVAVQLASEHGLAMTADWPMPLLGVDCFVMNVPPDRSPENIAQDLSRDARVSWAQAMNVYRAQGHDDPLFTLQPAASEWQLAALHDTVTGRQVRVAVIDSGVERAHPDLARQIEASEDFVAGRAPAAEAHGTAVTGIIAAQADNGLGIAGVAPQARVLALRACWQASTDATLCSSLSLAQALHFAITHDARVINMSLSGPPDRLLGRLLDTALARGIAVVAAVDRAAPDGGFPAAHAGVIGVADTGQGPAAPGVVLAPGRDIPTTLTGARWGLVSGASYAAAHVSGLLALLREARDRRGPVTLTAQVVQAEATSGAREFVLLPDGRIDACASLSRTAGHCSCGCTAAVNTAPAVARQ